MGVRLLGTVDVTSDEGGPVALGPKERTILGVLATSAGDVVSDDRLIEALWGNEPPPTATKTLRSYVSRLRRAFGSDARVIVAEPSGYRLDSAMVELDTAAVEELLEMAAAATIAEQHSIAAALYRDALATWRGRSLGELADEPWATADAARLDELRLSALEDRIEADLRSGRHLSLVGELEALTSTHAYRDRLWAARIVALYRSGRQVDALRVFADLRALLAEELGLDPSPEMHELEARVLRHDPTLLLEKPMATDEVRIAAPVLPSGVVTFLLTDVVGSTRMWEESPRAMGEAIALHDDLIAGAVDESRGLVLKARGEGDSTFSVFARTSDAAAAALAIQSALRAVECPPGIDLRVRAAIHVGQAVERAGDYFGPAVNRAARLKSIAVGGEILLSRSAAELLLDEPSAPWSVEEVGERELKDLRRPEQVFRLNEHDEDARRSPVAAIDLALPLPRPLEERGAHVARRAELDTLLLAWQSSLRGERRGVFIAGEPGMGKTWLAAAVARAAHDDGALVLLGRCDEELRLPLKPVSEALRPLIEAIPEGALTALPGGGELSRLLPDLRALRRLDPPARDDPEAEQWMLFEAVRGLLELAAQDRPLVLVIDDLHWATKPTLLLLRHLLRSEGASRCLVLGTYRHTELDRTHPLLSMLADLRREGGAERLLLQGLDRDGVAAIAAASDTTLAGDVVDSLCEETGGNPFFVIEVLRHLSESDGDVVMPESVREVLSRRFDRLSPATNAALRVAAVLGPSFPLRLLEAVPDATTEGDLLDAVDEAVRAGLLVDLDGVIAFSHALVRQTLLDELSTTRRVRLHRKIAEAIEALDEGDRFLELLAHHFAEAATDGQARRAAEYAARVADRAIVAAAYEDAVRVAEHALEALDAAGADDLEARARLFIVLARSVHGVRERTRLEHLEVCRRALEMAMASGSLGCIVDAVAAAEPAALSAIDNDPLDAAIDAALQRRDQLDDPDVGLLLAVKARAWSLGWEEAAQLLDEAEALVGSTRHLGTVLRVRAIWAQASPDPSLLERLADRLAALPPSHQDLWTRNIALGARAMVATALCDRATLLEHEEEERARRAAISSWQHEFVHFIATAGDAQLDARWDDLAAICDEMVAYLPGDPAAGDVWGALQMILSRETGRAADVLPMLEHLRESSPYSFGFAAACALLYSDVGRLEDARALVRELSPRLASEVRSSVWPIYAHTLAETAAVLGDADAARILLPEITPWAGLLIATAGGSFIIGSSDTVRCGLHLAVGDTEAAIKAGRAAVEQAERMESVWLRARALLWLGRAEARADFGRQTLDRAVEVARAAGMPAVAAAASASIEELENPTVDLALQLPTPLARRGDRVARAADLAQVRGAWSAVRAGERRAVFIAGEPGMGKTWLAAAAAREAHEQGAVVLLGRCDDELRLPYQAMTEAVRPLLDSLSPSDLRRLRHAGELARLVPDAPSLRGHGAPIRDDADAELMALAEAVAELLEVVSRSAPIVLVMDDLHWAARPLLLLLRHLMRTDRETRLLVLATYRHTELGRVHPLSSMLADLRREPGTERLLLQGLDLAAVEMVVGSHERADRDDGFMELLHTETGGNPLFVVEVLRHLDESDDVVSIPESVREVLSRRFDRLSDAANSALRVAAVLAPSFPLRFLEAIPDAGSPETIVDAIEESIGAGLLVDHGNAIAFSHALVRQTLIDELSTARRVRLHRVIGESIERLPDAGAHIELLAHHFTEAAVDGRPESAARFAHAAAEQAIAVGAYDHAHALVTRALDALAASGVVAPDLRVPLLVSLANVLPGVAGGTREQHLELSDEIIDLALASDSLDLLTDAIDVRSRISDDDGDERLRRAAAALAARRDELDATGLATLLYVESTLTELASEWERSQRLLAEAEAVAPPGSKILVRVLERRTLRGASLPSPTRLLDVADMLERFPAQSLDLWARNAILGLRAVASLQSCDLPGFLDVCAQTDARVGRTGGGYLFKRTDLIGRAARAQLAGAWDDLASVSAELIEQPSDGWTLPMWAGMQFVLHRETGRLEDFLPAFESVAQSEDPTGIYRMALALLHAEVGRTEEAARGLRSGLDQAIDRQGEFNGTLGLLIASLTAASVDDADASTRLLPHLDEWSGILILGNGGSFVVGLADEARSRLLLTIDEPQQAADAARTAVALANQMQAPQLLARAHLALGAAQLRLGDPAARSALEEAKQLADRLGMAPVATAAAKALVPKR